MGKKPLPSRQPELLKNEKWVPYIRYEKETDTWITKAIRKTREGTEGKRSIVDNISSKIKIMMDRKQLDIISRLIAYMYHDKKDEYEEIASDLRKEHIYKDLRSIDQWLNIQYNRLEKQEEKDKKINTLDQEIINEQSK